MFTKQVQDHFKFAYEQLYQNLYTTFTGLPCDFIYKSMRDDTAGERQAVHEELWE
ncbi:hypothetical protein JVT61DRAFT_7944 [Boletus reticuloceps]|uniref:Uncharacterized protein n=1 Tax=Boletus reticuloceps TaxID=495285 RepID=A0A8I2YHC8_9AGAM|nr:hypothetical protein JVT61DRAFT_7944 [Boletus reticuloceps]